jgi:DNA (cytosine-5)-methyltransferase 1
MGSHDASSPLRLHETVTLRVLDLFSGIGGFSLGLERAGMRTVAFCEIEPYCRAVLRKHWPDVPIFEDVRNLRAEHVGTVDVICGGFPCQDISLAGKGAGLAGERSGLWSEYQRLISELRPAWVIAENVSALRSRGLDQVLGSLAEIGYDAEWHCIPAAHVGAPHQRDRVWIVAYPGGEQHEGASSADARAPATRLSEVLYPADEGWPADDAMRGRREAQEEPLCPRRNGPIYSDWWATEPAVDRVADGVPSRVDRLRALGNAVVPQIPELIGRAILQAEGFFTQ